MVCNIHFFRSPFSRSLALALSLWSFYIPYSIYVSIHVCRDTSVEQFFPARTETITRHLNVAKRSVYDLRSDCEHGSVNTRGA